MTDPILTRPGTLSFPSNRALLSESDNVSLIVRQPASGHGVVYGPHGRRILAVDPAGHPLHECEWSVGRDGKPYLVQARVRLDWDQWVGLKPHGLVNRTVLDLSKKPGWQRLSADDLREMAARAMGVPFDAVKFFYTDDALIIDAQGRATIRHSKDALYVLEQGTFEAGRDTVRFMACMGAMHWSDIDFLPVVELFQSLLPGTGSAVFEMIRGLYDDQNQGRTPRHLRYRGIPPYPSEGAYKLFSTFFAPRGPAGVDPVSIFMDPRRSHEVSWSPVADPPLRYFDGERRLCVTVQGGVVQKATLADDTAGLSFLNVGEGGLAPCARAVSVRDGHMVLHDAERTESFPIRPEWHITRDSAPPRNVSPSPDWRTFFGPALPHVLPRDAYSAVLLYPEDETEIGEVATQPFVSDYLEDQRDSPELRATLARSERVLVDGFDASVTALIEVDRPRDCVVLFRRPAFAQKQAQILWNRLARTKGLTWMQRIRFIGEERRSAISQENDLAYVWIPFASWKDPLQLTACVRQIGAGLKLGGTAFIVGPAELASDLGRAGIQLQGIQPVESFPAVGMHRSIIPQARLKASLTLFQVKRVR